MHTLKRSAPVPELLYFFICDVPEQDLWLVDVVPWRQDAGQVIALLQKVISQVQGLSWYIQLLLHLQETLLSTSARLLRQLNSFVVHSTAAAPARNIA